MTNPDASFVLFRRAFDNEAELAKTLFEETHHVQQVIDRGYPRNADELATYEHEAKAALKQWWDNHRLNKP